MVERKSHLIKARREKFYMTSDSFKMVKPKRKLSKVVIVGVTTPTMCFNCYCHQRTGSIMPYQRMAKRRKAIRYRSRNGLPFRFRFASTTETHHIIEVDIQRHLLSFLNLFDSKRFFFRLSFLEKRATVQAQDR